MCNIAPVLTRTGVFYVVKTLVPDANDLRGGGPLTASDPMQATSEVADHPASDLRGGARQATSEVADHPANGLRQATSEVADHHKKDKEKTV